MYYIGHVSNLIRHIGHFWPVSRFQYGQYRIGHAMCVSCQTCVHGADAPEKTSVTTSNIRYKYENFILPFTSKPKYADFFYIFFSLRREWDMGRIVFCSIGHRCVYRGKLEKAWRIKSNQCNRGSRYCIVQLWTLTLASTRRTSVEFRECILWVWVRETYTTTLHLVGTYFCEGNILQTGCISNFLYLSKTYEYLHTLF